MKKLGKKISNPNVYALPEGHPVHVLVEEKEECTRYALKVRMYDRLTKEQKDNLFKYRNRYYTFEGE